MSEKTSPQTSVINLEERQRQRGGDDARFLVCPKCDGAEYAVVCRFNGNRPFIAALVCTACEDAEHIDVIGGELADE